MGYVPEDAEWWLADLVEVIAVEGRARVRRHVNRRLINAHSAAEAYERAMALGRESNLVYRNEAGRRVRTRFLGLAQLLVLHDGVEDGAEIEYFAKTFASVEAARKVVRRKRELSVFLPRQAPSSQAAEFVSADVMARLRATVAPESLPASPRRGRARRTSRKWRPGEGSREAERGEDTTPGAPAGTRWVFLSALR